MDLREKKQKTLRYLEWILRFRWPILIFFMFPVLNILQTNSGFVFSAFLGQIHTQAIFPINSGNFALLDAACSSEAWIMAIPWLLSMGVFMAFSPLKRLLPLILASVLWLALSYTEYSPWLSIAGFSFFASYALARLYAPVALGFAYLFLLVLIVSGLEKWMDLLKFNLPITLPYLTLSSLLVFWLLMDLFTQHLSSWFHKQKAREMLVKISEKWFGVISKVFLIGLGALLVFSAIPTGIRWQWILSTLFIIFSNWLLLVLFVPAWLSTLPLKERN